MSIDDELRKLREGIRMWARRCPAPGGSNDLITPTKLQRDVCVLESRNPEGYPEGGGDGVGDSVLFSAILCYSGEAWACESVRRSQGPDGKLWRAPQRVGRDQDYSYIKDGKDSYHATFSRDHLLGVLLWMVTMKNRGRSNEAIEVAEKWWNWIAEKRCAEIQKAIDESSDISLLRDLINNPKETSERALDIILGGSVPSRYRICDGNWDYCSISLIPYGHWGRLMLEVWRYIGAATSVSKSVEIPISIPGFDRPSISIPFDLAEYSVCDYNIIFQQNDLAVRMDKGEFHDQLNVVTALILRTMGIPNGISELTVQNIAIRNPNPFFLWAAGRITEAKEKARDLCPEAKPLAMIQWAWERSYSEAAWTESFGWDFIAVFNLLLRDLTSFPHLDGAAPHADLHTDISPKIDFHGDTRLTPEVKTHLDSPAVPAMSAHGDSPVIPEVKVHLDSPAIPEVKAHLDSPAIPAVRTHADTPVIPAVRTHADTPVIPAVRTHADTPVVPGVRTHIDTPKVGHGDMHGDAGHVDMHGDRWGVRAHGDTPGGGPHTDVRGVVHGDAHTDTRAVGHVDAHTDTPSVGHVDTHTDTSEVGHIDAHTDTPEVGHIDAHTDTPEVGHIDTHTDTPEVGHIDAHTDTPEVGHIDAHTDIPAAGHADAHTDVAEHADAHSDAPPAHLDVP